MSATVLMNARVPTQLAEQLRIQAVRNDRSVSAELRRAISAHVSEATKSGDES